MKTAFKSLVFVLPLMFMLSADFVDQTPLKITGVRDAEAIVGLPFTPVSVAGVARRTTRRAVVATSAAATATAASAAAAQSAAPPPPAQPQAVSAVPIGTVVQTLPAACTSVVVNGVNYSDCGGVFYKAAFQGNNLVYVVVQKPFN